MHTQNYITANDLVQNPNRIRVFITISPRINCWILSSTTQSSRKLNIALGWQKIEEDVRLVLDNYLEKSFAKFVSTFS